MHMQNIFNDHIPSHSKIQQDTKELIIHKQKTKPKANIILNGKCILPNVGKKTKMSALSMSL